MGVDQPERTSYPYVAKPAQRTILGHPAGLVNLFLTEMWERFSCYGMRVILVLFLVDPPAQGGIGLRPSAAAALYGVYNAVVYLLALPGGWVADRLTGARRVVLVGGVAIAGGHYVLAIPSGVTVYFGLILVAFGTGLLKPNVSTMVGELYDRLPDDHHAKRDAGFSWFYAAINVGAWSGVLVTGWLAQEYGWHVAFAAAAIGMTLGLIQYVAAGRQLGDVGLQAHRPIDPYRRAPVRRRLAISSLVGLVGLMAAAALLAEFTGHSVLESLLLLIPPIVVAVSVGFFRTMVREPTLTPPERSRIHAYVPIFAAAALFWMIYGQASSLLNRTADHDIDDQSINPLLIVLIAPLFAVMWARLGDRAPATPVKFAFGLVALSGSLLLVGFASAAEGGGSISPLWLLSIYLTQTVAELFVAPVGLSVTTRLAPVRFASQMMGLWFLATATGIAIGGYVVRINGVVPDAVYYGLLGVLAVGAGSLLFRYAPQIRRLMAGVD